MCGRFTLRTPAVDLIEIFEIARSFEIVPRYNIAPTQQVLAVRETDGVREPVQLRWGLLPSWSDAETGGRHDSVRRCTHRFGGQNAYQRLIT